MSASNNNDIQAFVSWFRQASPYIHVHRGHTFVVQFDGEAIADAQFAQLIHDLALLNSLGVRLVLVFGARPQIDARLAQASIESRFHKDMRVTDSAALEHAKEITGRIRLDIEALLSMGPGNTPMRETRLQVSSGNFITAQPLGIHDGIDFEHTGEVRRVDTQAIQSKLDRHEIVLVPPIGYSPTGEAFNLSARDVAAEVAVSLQAAKLIYLTESDGLCDADGQLVRQLSEREAERLIDGHANGAVTDQVAHAIYACKQGVVRTHLINRSRDGALLLELFSRDGVGTMISAAPFDDMRTATIEDVAGVLELIEPLEQSGVLAHRSREKLELEIDHFTILLRDDVIIGCAALYPFADEKVAEIACLAIHETYQNQGRGDQLFASLEREARRLGMERVFVLTTHAPHWFLERGFREAKIDDLPVKRKELYNIQRNSKVLIKSL
ncbi:amino-acid N-acetyltransferase [Methylohalomonas lacus]|uniref:Amino-acid acetyltransferase n=1 Tax=Methylohalomonas lacus TaxID=398773 RepID=A0AAE3L0P3_9GAMM|nr:amino-acid N-acetyltransferase [Methylohalomonas lacus]MCS3902874.1 amino-acid N-acetyltransferase [Methylohalomonas lacus]